MKKYLLFVMYFGYKYKILRSHLSLILSPIRFCPGFECSPRFVDFLQAVLWIAPHLLGFAGYFVAEHRLEAQRKQTKWRQ